MSAWWWSPGSGGAVLARAWPGPGGAVRGSGGPHGSDAREREREKWEKERAGLGTIPAYVGQADTSADEHKRAGLHGSRGTLCSSATR
jgi:hypothetical protein